MDTSTHTTQTLFDQLGLDSDPAAIESFILEHKPLPADIRLSEAPFWSAAQARFLRDGIAADSDWAEVIDDLDTRFRH